MRFPDYFKPLAADEKKRFAKRLGVSLGYLYRLAGGFSTPSLPLAKDIQRLSSGSVAADEWTTRRAA